MDELTILLDNWPDIISGFGITIASWAGAVLIGMIVGCLLAIMQLSAGRTVAAILRAYIEILRTIPFLILLFLLYYGGPSLGIRLQAFSAGVVSLGIYGSAYFAEIFRSGFLSVPRGQVEAADCLGITRIATVWRIQIPQMLVVIVPALINMIIILSKETAVLSIITVPELTAVLTQIGSQNLVYLGPLVTLCVCYLILVGITQKLGSWVEIKVGKYLQHE